MEEHVIPLLKEAYKLEPNDLDIIYNLTSSLTLIKEYNLALEHLNNLNKSNYNLNELKDYIINQIQ